MPTDKNIRARHRLLDQFLQYKKGYTIDELLQKCNERLELDEFPVINKRTIQNDLLNLELDYGAEIIKIKDPLDKRRHYIRYQNLDFSIFKTPLSSQDSAKILTALDTILSFKGLPQFDWLEKSAELMKQWTLDRGNTHRAILFEENLNLNVSENINFLYDAIRNKLALRIIYAPFDKEEEIHQISPYLLKQFNNRWFLLSKSDQHDFLINLALDRIKSISSSQEKYTPYHEDEPEYFYQDIVGVTRNKGESEKILVAVKHDLIPYLLTKPIHGSQKELKAASHEGWRTLEFDLIPNYEFYAVLLSHGPRIKVIAPEKVKQKMTALTTEMYNQYKDS